MGWRVLILEKATGGRLETGHLAGDWKIVPPVDWSLTHEEARELARQYGWPDSLNVRMEGHDAYESGPAGDGGAAEEGHGKKVSLGEARRIGDALQVDWSKTNLRQFARGLEVEQEHADVTGGDMLTTGRIALAHLKEDPDYYTKLDRAGLEAGEAMTTPTDIKKVASRLGASEARRGRRPPAAPRMKVDWKTIPRERWLTFPIGGGAYVGKIDETLTHSFDPETQTVLCGKVKPESILEDYSYDTSEAPTCEVCLKRLAKLKPSGAAESQKVAIRPFSGPDYAKHSKKVKPGFTECALCGKSIHDDRWKYSVHVLAGGDYFASTQAEYETDGGDGDMGVWPVGPDCAKVLKAAGVYVYNEKKGAAAEEIAGGECGCEHEGEAQENPTGEDDYAWKRFEQWFKTQGHWIYRNRDHAMQTWAEIGIQGLPDPPEWVQRSVKAKFGAEAKENPRHAADYPDLESALLGAQSKWDATHVTKQGDRITIFSPTSRGYKKRILFRQGGNLHWPDMHSTVEDLPDGAVTIHEATKLGWEPEDVERQRLPRAAEEAAGRRIDRKRLGEMMAPWGGDFAYGEGTGSIGAVASFYIGGHVYPQREYVEKALRAIEADIPNADRGKHGWTKKDARDLRTIASALRYYLDADYNGAAAEKPVQENPIEVASDGNLAKLTRDPKKYSIDRARAAQVGPIKNARDVYELLGPEMAKTDQELFVVVPLDIRGELRCDPIEVHRGARSRVEVAVADVLRAAIESGAEGIAVSHNHPTGKASPSDADKDLTKAIRKGCEAIEIAFVDHVIIGLNEFYSFEQKKLTRLRK